MGILVSLRYFQKKCFDIEKYMLLVLIILSLIAIALQNSYAKWQIIDTLKGHADAVNSVAFSSDGKLLASGSKDEAIILWNPLTGEKIRKLTGHEGSVYSVAFSHDGELLASCSEDEKIFLWNPETGKILRTMQHNGVRSLAFSPDGRILASASSLGTIRLWNPNTGEQNKTIQKKISLKHKEHITSVAFSADGKLLASGSWDNTIKLWNIEIKKEETLTGHNHVVSSVTFSSDGRLLASGSWDKTVKLWNPKTKAEIGTLSGHEAFVTSVAFSPNSKVLASCSWDGIIKLWNPHTGAEIITFSEHRGAVNAVAFSPGDEMLLASGSADGTIKLWQDIVLSVHIKNEDSFPKTITRKELRLEFMIEPQKVKAGKDVYYSSKLDDGNWSEPWEVGKTNFVELEQLTDGEHNFWVRIQSGDAKWDIDPTPAHVTFIVDVSPDTNIILQQETEDSVIFYLTGSDAQTQVTDLRYQWRIDGGEFSQPSTKNSATIPLNRLSAGEHIFEVRAIDSDGYSDPTPTETLFTVVISEQFPQTHITNPPIIEVINTNTFTFNFTGEDSQTPKDELQYSWHLDKNDWSAPSTKTTVELKKLTSGWHIFEVKAIDTDGNEDPSPAKASFEVEEQLPDTVITKSPESPVKTDTVTFQFSGEDLQTPKDKLLYSWCLNRNPWSTPSTKITAEFNNLTNGQHIFEVKAIDENNNEDATPAYESFEVSISEVSIEEQKPDTRIVEKPERPVRIATFKFTGIDLQTLTKKLRYSWRIDEDSWSELSPETQAEFRNLSSGGHIFEVKAVDADNNEDATPARAFFEVSEKPTAEFTESTVGETFPETRIIKAPERLVNTADVTFNFTGAYSQTPTEELKYSWRTDEDDNWTSPSPQTSVSLRFSDGRHWFQVKAIALDGREDQSPEEVRFTVDIHEQYPNTQIINPPKNRIKTPDFTFQFTGNDSQTSSEQLRSKNLSDGQHHFQVKAIDTDGNEDPTPAEIQFWVVIPWYKKPMILLFVCILSVIIIFSLIFFLRITHYTIWLGNLIADQPLGNVFNQLKKLIFNLQEEEDQAKRTIYNFRLQKDRLQNLGKISRQYSHAMRTPISAIDVGAYALSYGVPRIFNLMNQYEELFQLDNLDEIKSRLRQLQREREQMKLEKLHSTLEATQTAIKQMHNQMDDFSNIIREEYGQERKLTDMKLDDVISRIVRVIRAITYKGVDVRFAPGEIPPFRCDASRLATALIAIIENALEAILADGYVEISTKYHPSDKSVLISIQDTGPGIPKHIQDKVWDEFFTTKEKEEEAGIGLSIAKYVIEDELHGEIWFESTEGKGTKFFIKLNTETFEELN